MTGYDVMNNRKLHMLYADMVRGKRQTTEWRVSNSARQVYTEGVDMWGTPNYANSIHFNKFKELVISLPEGLIRMRKK